MTTTHELKTLSEFYVQVFFGNKPFEVRQEDTRQFRLGDTLRLREWVPDPAHPEGGIYTGREMPHRVTYVLRGERWGIKEGYCVLGIKPIYYYTT